MIRATPAIHARALRAAALLCLLPSCISAPGILGEQPEDTDGASDDDASDDAGGDSMTGAGPGSGGESDSGDDTGPDTSCVAPDAFGAQEPPSLTPGQWDAVVGDLLGVTVDVARQESTARVGMFEGGVALRSDADDVARGWAVAAAALADLDALLGCDPVTVAPDDELGCFQEFAAPFAEQAWRRPPAADELAALDAIITTDAAVPFPDRVRAAIAEVLADRSMWGIEPTGTTEDGLTTLDGPSLAVRLSLLLTGSLPDAELLAAGADGSLLDPAVLRAQAERLLVDPRATRSIDDFATQWLELQRPTPKDLTLFPHYDGGVPEALIEESLRFVRDVVLDGDARMSTLLTAPYTFANADVAIGYGSELDGMELGPAFERVDLDPSRRGGVLTQPAWLARHAHESWIGFTPRGLWINEALSCMLVPPPPADVDVSADPPNPATVGHKELWADAFGEPVCIACHTLSDPPGFAFDHYDAVGRWTEELLGAPVDATWDQDPLSFEGREDLLAQLIAGDDLGRCMAQHWFTYGLVREPILADACTVDAMAQAYADTDGDLRAVILALVESDAFRVMRIED